VVGCRLRSLAFCYTYTRLCHSPSHPPTVDGRVELSRAPPPPLSPAPGTYCMRARIVLDRRGGGVPSLTAFRSGRPSPSPTCYTTFMAGRRKGAPLIHRHGGAEMTGIDSLGQFRSWACDRHGSTPLCSASSSWLLPSACKRPRTVAVWQTGSCVTYCESMSDLMT
jgi:hypothetical protein